MCKICCELKKNYKILYPIWVLLEFNIHKAVFTSTWTKFSRSNVIVRAVCVVMHTDYHIQGNLDGIFPVVTEATDLKFGGQMGRVCRRMFAKFGRDWWCSFLTSNHFSWFWPKSLLLLGILESPLEILYIVGRVLCAWKGVLL